jgi:2-phosphosulfolactate phosphatase
VASPYAQSNYRVRFDWGPVGAAETGPGAKIVAVVDVLSFTTTLNVAVEHGIEVYPYRWRDETSVSYARSRDATLAVGRSQATRPGQISLSPATIRRSQGIERLVLPSPNGSTISQLLAARGGTVIGVCLRNAAAASAWAARQLGPDDAVAVIASGERWHDGTLRPAVEDMWGAGAFISGLAGGRSPEAEAAEAAWSHVQPRPPLARCASGIELISYGYPQDVDIAAEVNTSEVVPLLSGDSFKAAPG